MEETIITPLFSFNIGLELGQLMIVALVLVGAALAVHVFKVPHKSWNLFISGAAAGVSVILMIETKFW